MQLVAGRNDGFPRIDANTHSQIAGDALKVAYAGIARFEGGRVKAWSKKSGTFVLPSVLRYQADLGQAAGFTDEAQPHVVQSPEAREAARKAAHVASLRRPADRGPFADSGTQDVAREC